MVDNKNGKAIELFLRAVRQQRSLIMVGPTASFYDYDDDCNYFKIKKALPHLFIDGGINYYNNQKLQPFVVTTSLSIGDNDSVCNETETNNKLKPKLDINLNPIKDFSDFAAGLNLLKKIEINTMLVRGFLGGRIDHQIINMGEMHYFLKKRSKVKVQFDSTILAFSSGKYQLHFPPTPPQLASLIFFEKNQIELKGKVFYPISVSGEKKIRPLSSYTLSNVIEGKISLKVTSPTFLVLSDLV